MSRLELKVPIDFLKSRYAPRMCVFTGRQAGVVLTPIMIQKLRNDFARPLPPPEKQAELKRNTAAGRAEAPNPAVALFPQRPVRGDDILVALPHVEGAVWHNRAPNLVNIAIIFTLVLSVGVGISLFMEPDPAAMALKQGKPKPTPLTPPPPPTAISPVSPGAFVLYGSVAVVLWGWWQVRKWFVAVICIENEVRMVFPPRLRYVYETYLEAFQRYLAGSNAPARPTLPDEEWPDEVQQGWDEQAPTEPPPSA